MHQADIVLVPSQHHYVEGFPLVIQHALRSRTPLVVSNHPMFLDYLHHGSNAMIFPAGNASALASCVAELLTHPDLYTHLSTQSHNTWKQLRLPVKWADLIERWVQGTESDRQWLSDHRLTAMTMS
jgi:glycosyltransferase involved in cell wall biosynthesis